MNDVQTALRKRYEHIHPLLFLRSMEKARSNGELFDLLEGMPVGFPVVWCDTDRCWKQTTDLLQGEFLKSEERPSDKTG